MAAGAMPVTRRALAAAYRLRKWEARTGMSSRRSRSGGTRKVTTLRR